jgi:hypothetical protein
MKKIRKLSKAEAKARILSFASKKRRALCVGEVSVELGLCWSLSEAESLLDEMVDDGLLRVVEKKERREFVRS